MHRQKLRNSVTRRKSEKHFLEMFNVTNCCFHIHASAIRIWTLTIECLPRSSYLTLENVSDKISVPCFTFTHTKIYLNKDAEAPSVLYFYYPMLRFLFTYFSGNLL